MCVYIHIFFVYQIFHNTNEKNESTVYPYHGLFSFTMLITSKYVAILFLSLRVAALKRNPIFMLKFQCCLSVMSSKVTFSERKTLHSKIKVVYKLCLFIKELDPGLMWSGVQEGRLLDSPLSSSRPLNFNFLPQPLGWAARQVGFSKPHTHSSSNT